MSAPDRAAFTARLRAIADAIDAHDDVPVPVRTSFQFIVFPAEDEAAAMAATARALGGPWVADFAHSSSSDEDYMHLTADEDDLRIVISAHAGKVAGATGTRVVWTPLPSIAEFIQEPPEVQA